MSANEWLVWVAIAGGSAVGGVLRHVVSEAVVRLTGSGFPWGTLTVNVLGSLAVGGCAALSAAAAPGWTPVVRHATVTGLLGGFTTFSTFSAQTLALLQQDQWGAAAANAALSVGVSLLACVAGYASVSLATR